MTEPTYTVDVFAEEVLVGHQSAPDASGLGLWSLEEERWEKELPVVGSARRARFGAGAEFGWVNYKGTVAIGNADQPARVEFPGSWLCTAGGSIPGVCGPESLLWDTASGSVVWRFDGEPDTDEGVMVDGEAPVVCASPDGAEVAVAGEDRTAVLIRPLREGGRTVELEHESTSFTDDLSFSRDGRFVASVVHGEFYALCELWVWDLETGDRLPFELRDVWAIRFGPDGLLGAASDKGVTLWNCVDRRKVGVIRTLSVARDLAFDGAGRVLVATERGLENHSLDEAVG